MSSLLRPGDRVNDTYTVHHSLGAGAFAEVYLVSHRFLGEQALKAFPLDGDTSAKELLREARLLVDSTHPNIVRVYDANVCDNGVRPFAYVTMERSPGGTLADLLRSVTRLPIRKALEASLQIAAALSHTHSLSPPVVHRDVKPTNVLVFSDDQVLTTKLADYGLAATINPETRLCRSGGTLAFAPPEMAWGVADERTDVYRASCIIP